jgi:hypothetical protein
MIDISGLNKEAVLAALYNNSRPMGMGFIHYDPAPMTIEDARSIIHDRGDDVHAQLGGKFRQGYGPDTYNFDYLKGRVLKVNLSGDAFNDELYDRDLGEGAAQRVIDKLREES